MVQSNNTYKHNDQPLGQAKLIYQEFEKKKALLLRGAWLAIILVGRFLYWFYSSSYSNSGDWAHMLQAASKW